MRVGASGLVRQGTGIRVLQQALYPRIQAAGYDLIVSRTRDLGRGVLRTPIGMARGLLAAPRGCDVYLSAVPPMPFTHTGRLVSIVHDLRWRQTRGRLSQLYRAWDLHRTLKRSDAVICISERTYQDVLEFDPTSAAKLRVAWLGPGLFDGEPEAGHIQKVPGSVLLIGGGAHKRNELAAEVIATLPAGTISRVDGVGVAEGVKQVLDSIPHVETHWHSGISDAQMRQLYRDAEYFVLLGTDEGFGLPYIEGLVAGCTVVATDQPLTREILVDAAIRLPLGSPEEMARAWVAAHVPLPSARAEVAARYSWDTFASTVVAAIASRASEPARTDH